MPAGHNSESGVLWVRLGDYKVRFTPPRANGGDLERLLNLSWPSRSAHATLDRHHNL
jgi:hypothetical protein